MNPESSRHHSPSSRSAASRRPQTGRVTFLVAGFAMGCVLSGIVALYISQAPLPFVDRGLRKTGSSSVGAHAPADLGAASQGIDNGRTGEGYWVQVGAFRSLDEAERLRAQLALLGLEAGLSTATGSDGTSLNRVRLGPYPSLDDVNRVKTLLSENGLNGSVVKTGSQ